MAETYTIYLYDGKAYSDSTHATEISVIGGLVYIDNGWRMNNFDFTTTATTALQIDSATTITIYETNTITGGNATTEISTLGIYAPCDLTFAGDGTLSVTAGNSDYGSAGIWTLSALSVSADVTVESGHSTGSAGVSAFGAITVTGTGKLTAIGNGSDSCALSSAAVPDATAMTAGGDPVYWNENEGYYVDSELQPVTSVVLTAAAPTYSLAGASSLIVQGGVTFTVDSQTVTEAAEGATVTVAAVKLDDYYCTGFTSDQVTVTDNTFMMPAEAVTVTAVYAQYDKRIVVDAATYTKDNPYTLTAGKTYTMPAYSSGNGGAVEVQIDEMTYVDSGYLTGSNVTFAGNSVTGAGSYGGAIFNEGTTTLTNATFRNNSADDGGGAIYNTQTLTITDATFDGNSRTGLSYGGGGGAIYNTGTSTTTLTNVTFNNNTSASDGGAIFNEVGTAMLTNVTFTNNTALKQGGAIFVAGTYADSSSITINDGATFTNNMVTDADGLGGAIYVQSNVLLTFNDGAMFNGNSVTGAGGLGGAIYNRYSTITFAGTMDLQTDTDTWVNEGQSIYITQYVTYYATVNWDLTGVTDAAQSTVTVKGFQRYSNKKTAVGSEQKVLVNQTITVKAEGAQAAGDYVIATGDFDMNMLTQNLSTEFKVTDGATTTDTITVNGTAGVIGNQGYKIALVESDEQGADQLVLTVTNYTSDRIVVDNTYTAEKPYELTEGKTYTMAPFEGEAFNFGGAVYVKTDGNLTGTNVTFADNEITGTVGLAMGGVIYNYGSITLDGATFTGNTAVGKAGAICNDGGTITFNNEATFKDNTSDSFNGGAIYNDGTITFNGNTTFDGNTASTNGGAVFSSSTITFNDDATFKDNTASGNGGAVYNSASTLTFKNGATFNGNTAGKTGGAIYSLVGTINFAGTMDLQTETDTWVNKGSSRSSGNYRTTINWDLTGVTDPAASTVCIKGFERFSNLKTDLVDSQGEKTGESEVLVDQTFTVKAEGAQAAGSYVIATGDFDIDTLTQNNSTEFKVTDGTGTTGTITVNGTADYIGMQGYKIALVASDTEGADQLVLTVTNYTSEHITVNTTTYPPDGLCELENATYTVKPYAGNGGAVDVQAGGSLSGENVTFSGNETSGDAGAVYIDSTETGPLGYSAVFTDTSFENNTANCTGGAIRLNSGTMKLTNVSFDQNTANTSGGAIAVHQGTEAVFEEAVFSNNFAAMDAGAIFNSNAEMTITDSQFTDNTADTGRGGAIYNAKNLTLKDVTFSGNKAPGSDGGAIYNAEGGSVTIDGTTIFSDNQAFNSGAIYNADGGTVNLNGDKVTFAGNKVTDSTTIDNNGGAINNSGTVTCSSKTVTFSENTADGYGGAINNYSSVEFSSDSAVTFSSNVAGKQGGAISNGGTVTINGAATFSGNSTTAQSGGAIFNTNEGTIVLNSATFDDNHAKASGGAIFIWSGSVTIKGEATFTGNTADTKGAAGGAIYNQGTLNLNKATFSGNSVTGDETCGAIRNDGTVNMSGTVTLDTETDTINNKGTLNWNLTGDTAGKLEGYQYLTNSGSLTITVKENGEQAAGKYVIATGDFDMDTLDQNNTLNFTVTDGTSTTGTITVNGTADCIDMQGYKIALVESETEGADQLVLTVTNYDERITVDNTYTAEKPYELTAGKTYTVKPYKGNGGAVEVQQGGNLTGTSVTFADNEVTSQSIYGGAIYSEGTVTLTGGTFTGNTATAVGEFSVACGGAIYNTGTMTLTGGTFSSNTATTHGGAIFNAGSITITDGTFNSNTSNLSSGALVNVDTITFNGTTTVSSNSACYTGGAFSNSGTMTFNGVAAFNGNTLTGATGYGGAIYNTGTITFNGTASFNGNTAYGGGAIYNNCYAESSVIHVAGTVDLQTSTDTWVNTGYYYTDEEPSAEYDTTVNWDLTGVTDAAQSTVLIKGFQWYSNQKTNVEGVQKLLVNQTITVKADQAAGDYVIATGDFDLAKLETNLSTAFTVKTAEDTGKSITVGGDGAVYNGLLYTLAIQDGGEADDKLVLTAKAYDSTTLLVNTNWSGMGIGDEVTTIGGITYYYGANAFSTAADAAAAITDSTTAMTFYGSETSAGDLTINKDLTIKTTETETNNARLGTLTLSQNENGYTVSIDNAALAIDTMAGVSSGDVYIINDSVLTVTNGVTFSGGLAVAGSTLRTDTISAALSLSNAKGLTNAAGTGAAEYSGNYAAALAGTNSDIQLNAGNAGLLVNIKNADSVLTGGSNVSAGKMSFFGTDYSFKVEDDSTLTLTGDIDLDGKTLKLNDSTLTIAESKKLSSGTVEVSSTEGKQSNLSGKITSAVALKDNVTLGSATNATLSSMTQDGSATLQGAKLTLDTGNNAFEIGKDAVLTLSDGADVTCNGQSNGDRFSVSVSGTLTMTGTDTKLTSKNHFANYGTMTISSGAELVNTTPSYGLIHNKSTGVMTVDSATLTASNKIANDGTMTLKGDNTLTGTNNGVENSSIGTMTVESGTTTVNGTVVNSGTINLKGGTLTAEGLTNKGTGTLNWDLTSGTSTIDWSKLTNETGSKLNITVKAEEVKDNSYTLASNASGATGSFTLTGVAGQTDTTISVGGKAAYNTWLYGLNVDANNDLKLTVLSKAYPKVTVTTDEKWFNAQDETVTVTGTVEDYIGEGVDFTVKVGEAAAVSVTLVKRESSNIYDWSYTYDGKDTDGTKLVFTATDKSELKLEGTAEYNLTVDRVAPAITFSGDDPQYYAAAEGIHWYKRTDTAGTITATGSDETSGVESIKLDGDEVAGESRTVTLDLSAEMDNAKTMIFKAVDYAGNEESDRTFTYNVDGTGPSITNAAVSNSYPSGTDAYWVKKDADVTVSANVEDLKSGVKEVTFDGKTVTGTEGAYSRSYDTATEKAQTAYVIAATDNVGNESDQTLMIGVDGTPVVVGEFTVTGNNTSEAEGGTGTWVKAGVDFTVSTTVTDAKSGVKDDTVVLNGENLTRSDNDTFSHTYNKADETGLTDWTLTANDNVGNEQTATVKIGVDGTGPVIGETSITGDNVYQNWIKTGTAFAVNTEIIDAKSGLDNATLEGVSYANNKFDLTAGADGDLADHTITAADKVGNEKTATVNYGFDGTGPVIDSVNVGTAYKAGENSYWVKQNEQVMVSANIADNKSGVQTVIFDGVTAGGIGSVYTAAYSTAEEHGLSAYKIGATDKVGNDSDTTIQIGVDGTGPTMLLKSAVTETVYSGSVTGAPDSATASTTKTVDAGTDLSKNFTSDWFSAKEGNFTVTIEDQILKSVMVNGAEQTLSGTSFDYTFSNLVQGANTFAIVAEDQVGNKTESTITLNYDSEAPVFAANSITVEGVDYTGQEKAAAYDNPVIVTDIDNFTVTLNATDTSDLTSWYSFSANGTDGWTEWTTADAAITSGEGYYRFATVDAAGNTAIADKYFYIGRQIEYTLSDAVDVIYDGQEHGITVTITDPEGGIGASVYYSIDGGETWTLTEDSKYMLTDATVEGPVSVCFKLTAARYCDTFTESTTINIAPKRLSVSGTTVDDKVYDGTTDAVIHEGTLSGIVEGDEVTLAAEGTFNHADASRQTITVQYSLEGADAQNYETIIAESISAAITKRQVILTSASDSKVYDGTPLTNGTVTVSGDGWLEGDGASYTVTGSQRKVGSSANTFSYELNEGTNAANYSISQQYGTLTVEAPEVMKAARNDLNGNNISDVVFQYTGGDRQLGYWMDGTNEWLSGNTGALSENWTPAGAADMNADGKADVVMTGTFDNSTIIGYYKNGDGSDWTTLGSVAAADAEVKLGNMTGNDSCNSVVFHSAVTGELTVWEDGDAENSKVLAGSLFGDWKLTGTGDFNRDGAAEAVLAGNGGFYSIDMDGKVTNLANLGAGWEIKAIGDFNNDGTDDLVIFNEEFNLLAKLGSGKGENFEVLGQLDSSDWFVAGAGDYNGDLKDDLLVRQNSTGMLGYYAEGDMNKWNTLGYGVDMNWTVIA